MTAKTSCDNNRSLLSLEQVTSELNDLAMSYRQILSAESTAISLPLSSALGQVLSEEIKSDINVPPKDNSAVDGYAVNTHTLKKTPSPATLNVSQRIPAGTAPTALEDNTAARIFTGATIPEGTNAVLMQEDCQELEGGVVQLPHDIKEGQNIRRQGQDVFAGQSVLKIGTRLTPQAIGIAASVGQSQLVVNRPLKVAILSTGDELVEPGYSLSEGQIYNSNRYLLSSLLTALNCEVVDLGVIKDTLQETVHALKHASQSADVIISTGGASVGEEDHVQAAIKQLGALSLWKIAIKPGKPFMLGKIDEVPVLGLPGNPSAVLVTFLMLAKPFLQTIQGQTKTYTDGYKLPIDFPVKRAGTRREFLRVRRTKTGALEKYENQSSGMLTSAHWAEGLAVIPEHATLEVGELVTFYPFSQLLSPYT